MLRDMIYSIISEWSNDYTCGFDGIWWGYDALEDELNTKFKKLFKITAIKEEVKKMTREGILERRPTYDGDYKLNGSGYFIKTRL